MHESHFAVISKIFHINTISWLKDNGNNKLIRIMFVKEHKE